MIVAGAMAALVLLSGCGEARKAFGIDRSTPDEFAVVSRAPLTLPPEYSLRPPEPGAPRPQEGTASDRGRALLAGDTTGTAIAADGTLIEASVAENALLNRAGAAQRDPDIRRTVNQESTDLLIADQNFVDRLLFWQDGQAPGDIIDPAAERQRLATNAALGRPINEGEVPIIVRKERAPLEGLFDF